MIIQVAVRYLEYLYHRASHLYEKHKKCSRDLKNIKLKVPPGMTEMSLVFNHDVVEMKCDDEDIQDFFKTLKELLLILQDD